MKLLIIVDYQVDFVVGSLGFPKAKTIEAKILKKVETYQKNHDAIIFTLDTHEEDYLSTEEGKHLPVIHAQSGTEGHELYGALQLIEGLRIEKTTFGSIGLLEYLQRHSYETIELVGLVTNICLLANAVIAKTAQPNTPIIIDAECCASYDEDLHKKALDVMKGLQIDIRNRG